MIEDIRNRLGDSISHLARVIKANELFITEIQREATSAAAVTADITRQKMVAEMASGLNSLTEGVSEVTVALKQKLVTCELLYGRMCDSSNSSSSEIEVATQLLQDLGPEDDAWVSLVAELIASGTCGTALEGIVLPFLRKCDVPAFRQLCE